MAEILMKAASFVAIIAMGYCLRRAGCVKDYAARGDCDQFFEN